MVAGIHLTGDVRHFLNPKLKGNLSAEGGDA